VKNSNSPLKRNQKNENEASRIGIVFKAHYE